MGGRKHIKNPNVLGFSRETEPIGDRYRKRLTISNELTHAVMKTKKSLDLYSISWRPREVYNLALV